MLGNLFAVYKEFDRDVFGGTAAVGVFFKDGIEVGVGIEGIVIGDDRLRIACIQCPANEDETVLVVDFGVIVIRLTLGNMVFGIQRIVYIEENPNLFFRAGGNLSPICSELGGFGEHSTVCFVVTVAVCPCDEFIAFSGGVSGPVGDFTVFVGCKGDGSGDTVVVVKGDLIGRNDSTFGPLCNECGVLREG